MGGLVLSDQIQKILEMLVQRETELNRRDIEIAITNLVIPSKIPEDEMRLYFENIYSYFHNQFPLETFEQKRARQLNTREFYRMLGVKLLRGKPQHYAEIPKEIFARKVQEKTLGEINQSVFNFFKKEEEESGKAFANAVLKQGGGKKKKRTRRMRR